MGEFIAWAATGIVVGLQSWSAPAGRPYQQAQNGLRAPGFIGALVHRQRFFLRQQNGRDIEILLADSGIGFRNGHAVTAVWAARKSAAFGHCIYLENHSTGAIARLSGNVGLVRTRTRSWRYSLFAFLATFPAALMLLGWLILHRGTTSLRSETFFLSTTVGLILLFVIGAVVSKLVFDYLRINDEQKIWLAADRALLHARRVLIQRPMISHYT
jgi:hypothetical protein